MSLIADILIQYLPNKRRVTPKGWQTFNAPCCSHRGHRPDTRMRGNIKIGEDGTIGGNCYNCGFKFRFDGLHVSHNFEQFLTWIGVDNDVIHQIKMEAFKKSIEGGNQQQSPQINYWQRWETVDLPDGCVRIDDESVTDQELVIAREYIHNRGQEIANGYDYFWCPQEKHQLKNRVILPFYDNNRIVGYTGRYCGVPPDNSIPRYWNSSIPDGYLFNNDVAEIPQRKFIILVEGPFDAIAVQGVAALGSTLSEKQIHWISKQEKQVILLPDRQKKNQYLIDIALSFDWFVSFPDWEDNIKDAADACKSYGQIYTVSSIIQSKTTDPIEIGIKRKMFKN